MYYVEFVQRNPHVSLPEFHAALRERTLNWIPQLPEDRLLYMLGRGWNLGPEPPYVVIWWAKDMARFEDWRSALGKFDPRVMVSMITDAGVYDDLGEEQL